jgi:hypothetical protein
VQIFTSIREAVYGNRRRSPGLTEPEADVSRPEPHAIDIENHLDSMPGADHLNWRTSIVDLMDLIGVDSSVEARIALAQELGYDGALDGSQDMDNWLHARVLGQLSEYDGNARAEFGD